MPAAFYSMQLKTRLHLSVTASDGIGISLRRLRTAGHGFWRSIAIHSCVYWVLIVRVGTLLAALALWLIN